jgi:hypothetical protein
MKNSLFPMLIVSLALVSGCAKSTNGDVDETDPCGAQGHTALLGSNIAAVTLPADLNDRVIGPNDAVTADFSPQRLNIETDADGLIIGLSCG